MDEFIAAVEESNISTDKRITKRVSGGGEGRLRPRLQHDAARVRPMFTRIERPEREFDKSLKR